MRCFGCGKSPEDITEYIAFAADSEMSPEEFVRQEEGTFDPIRDTFMCTSCYIQHGCPARKMCYHMYDLKANEQEESPRDIRHEQSTYN